MNVILANPSYPQTFWSFDNVLKMTGKKALIPPLGLITVASLLPQDWKCKAIDLVFQKISEKDWAGADLVIVSGMIVQSRGILETIREAKKRGKKVLVGGPWAFHFPEDAIAAGADIVVVGEAETVMPRVLECLENGISGVVIKPSVPVDLEGALPPRFDLLDIHAYVDMAVQFSRGCPFHCDFCDVTLMLGRRVRTKTPKQILEELNILYNLGWRRAVFFVDDNFIGSVAKAEALLEALIPWSDAHGRPFSFYTQASVNLASLPVVLDLMINAGFTQVFLGVETPDEDSLRASGKFQNVAVDLDRACQTINQAGMMVIAGCIVGFDNETHGADGRLIKFAIRNQIPEMFVSLLQAAPGTALWQRLENEGRLLSQSYEQAGNQTYLMNFLPTRPIKEIVEEFTNLYTVLYERDCYLKRVLHHLLPMRPRLTPRPFQMPYLYEVKALLTVLARYGFRYSSWLSFWKCLFTLLRHNPQRLTEFFTYCSRCEHYTQFAQTIAEELHHQLASPGPGILEQSVPSDQPVRASAKECVPGKEFQFRS